MADADKILIVEDELLVAMHLADHLEELGYEVLGCASSIVEVRELTGREPPALALVDINLRGDKNGVDVAAELARDFNTEIIFMSGLGDMADERISGVVPLGIVTKPWIPADLASVIGRSKVRPGQGAGNAADNRG